MAITAWLANVSRTVTCSSVNGRTSYRSMAKMPIGRSFESNGTVTRVRKP